MGLFDTVEDDKGNSVQVKLLGNDMVVYKVGEKIPLRGESAIEGPWAVPETFTVVLPDYEEKKYAVVKEGKIEALTNDENQTVGPYYNKWGETLYSIDDKNTELDFMDFYNVFQPSSNWMTALTLSVGFIILGSLISLAINMSDPFTYKAVEEGLIVAGILGLIATIGLRLNNWKS